MPGALGRVPHTWLAADEAGTGHTHRPPPPPASPPPSRNVNRCLPLGTGRGILLAMTSIAAHRETAPRVVRSAMRAMMFMMMMPMMHRQPSL